MLVKDLKINNIKRQREFIMKELRKLIEKPKIHGDTAYRYLGDIFPEVIQYLSDEGFDTKLLTSDKIDTVTKGVPLYLITVREDVVLTAEELKMAEKVECNFEENELPYPYKELLDMLFK